MFFQESCQFNAKSGAIDQLRLGDQPVDCYQLVGHLCCGVLLLCFVILLLEGYTLFFD